ncbi:MAG: hypothetical protein J1E64_12990 [Acetatifactor sp.]|nr:hypothetical protein [Acetatifactor sp.]
MIVLKILGIVFMVLIVFFAVTFVIYFFNLDMKLMALLIKPMTKYYDWSKARRDAKKLKKREMAKAEEKK